MLIFLGIGQVVTNRYLSERHYEEAKQRLCWDLAAHLVKETNPLVNGLPDTAATHDIMHSMMVINPSVEVYLLDPTGQIIDYVVPNKNVKRTTVDLTPIHTFLNTSEQGFILGDDPKSPSGQNIFSAAPILEKGQLTGYAYIILSSQEQADLFSSLSGNYMLKTGSAMVSIMLLGALIIGLILVWFLTKNLRQIIDVFVRFKNGDLTSRISKKQTGELTLLADTFNDMADTIVENIDQIKSVEALRRELIANVSHDLRTPLSIMQGYIETLLIKTNIAEKDREHYLNIVLSSSERLSKLVGQLFEFSKLESNQIEVAKEPFQISDLVNDVYFKYQLLASEKDIDLQLNTEGNLPLVFADVALVERVIQNLMDNALKFSHQGGKVTLHLKEAPRGVEISISDNGPGIPEKEQPFIFERYHRARNPATKATGSGLGLAIVKKILDIHQATIQVKSSINQGATFWFQLPAYQQ